MPAQNEAVMIFDYQGAVITCLLDKIIILLSGNASLLNPVLCICIQMHTHASAHSVLTLNILHELLKAASATLSSLACMREEITPRTALHGVRPGHYPLKVGPH